MQLPLPQGRSIMANKPLTMRSADESLLKAYEKSNVTHDRKDIHRKKSKTRKLAAACDFVFTDMPM